MYIFLIEPWETTTTDDMEYIDMQIFDMLSKEQYPAEIAHEVNINTNTVKNKIKHNLENNYNWKDGNSRIEEWYTYILETIYCPAFAIWKLSYTSIFISEKQR